MVIVNFSSWTARSEDYTNEQTANAALKRMGLKESWLLTVYELWAVQPSTRKDDAGCYREPRCVLR